MAWVVRVSPFFQVSGSPCSDITGDLRTSGIPPLTIYGPFGWTVTLRSLSAFSVSFESDLE